MAVLALGFLRKDETLWASFSGCNKIVDVHCGLELEERAAVTGVGEENVVFNGFFDIGPAHQLVGITMQIVSFAIGKKHNTKHENQTKRLHFRMKNYLRSIHWKLTPNEIVAAFILKLVQKSHYTPS